MENIGGTDSSYKDFVDKIAEGNSLDWESFCYVEKAIGCREMGEVIEKYKEIYSDFTAYTMLKNNLNNIFEEAMANNFDKIQVKDLFFAASNLETGNSEKSQMTFYAESPDFAPSHEIRDVGCFGDNYDYLNLLKSNDRSSRTNYETTGVGYEVKSKLGYNRTTTFLRVGSCNAIAPSGKAGYMFYTIYYDNKYQDIGIGYFGGNWKAVVSGNWTGWGIGNINISAGDKLYFKIWIGADSRIYFQILDGNDFSRILFENSYTTDGEIPSSGNGVGFNRQITLVDTSHNPKSGLYLRDAQFDLSYLYNTYGYQIFNGSNTRFDRRGKFGCNWASDSVVFILNNTHWDSEKITIDMK